MDVMVILLLQTCIKGTLPPSNLPNTWGQLFKWRCFTSVQQNCILSHCQFAEHFFYVKAIYREQFYERIWGRPEFAFFVLKYPTKE